MPGDDELAAISPDNGWFVFAVVRHPTARLFSGWQSKLLLREPWWVDEFGDEEWFPRPPRSGEDIVSEFHRFVEIVARDPDQRIMRNRHFAPQGWMLAADRMPYSRIYKTSEISELLRDFDAHLRARGYGGHQLTLLRANETPLRPIAALFTPAVLDLSRELYADDFERFGYADPLPGGLDPADGYDDAVVAELDRLFERQERINDLALRAQRLSMRLRRATANTAGPAPAPPAARVRRLASRAKRRIVSR